MSARSACRAALLLAALAAPADEVRFEALVIPIEGRVLGRDLFDIRGGAGRDLVVVVEAAVAPAAGAAPAPAPGWRPLPTGGSDGDPGAAHAEASPTGRGTLAPPADAAAASNAAPRATERRLHVHHLGADGRYRAVPDRVVPVMDDVIAYTFADVRPEPGRELVFLTHGGAWSYSLVLEGYRDNVAPLVRSELFYDMPDPGSLPAWRYVVEPGPSPAGTAAGGAPAGTDGHVPVPGEGLLLAERFGFTVWYGASGATYDDGRSIASDNLPPVFEAGSRGTVSNGRGDDVSVELSRDRGPFLEPWSAFFSTLLDSDADYRAPALADANGDGRTDLLVRANKRLHVYLAGADGLPTAPTRTELEPDYLDPDDASVGRRLADIDGDGDVDVLAIITADADDLEPRVTNLLVLLNDGSRIYPQAPQQVLRFEASQLFTELVDVTGDGRTDLVVSKYDLPSLAAVATGFELRRSVMLFLGERGGQPFARRPAMRDEQIYDMDNLEEAIARRRVALDLSGDGLADLVEVDLSGRIAVRRLLLERGFFGGESWSLEAQPWKRFDSRSGLLELSVTDCNGDGIGDLTTHDDRSVSLFLSRRSGP